MSVKEQIKETKDNCLYIEVDLIGDGTDNNPYRADLPYNAYTHLDADTDIDYVNKKVKIYINKIKTPGEELAKIRKNAKIKILHEKTKGKLVTSSEHRRFYEDILHL
ncbi:MAG: hypothetical protein QMC85_07550 [Methanocellales archaeon]|nr:hypothetical protein [Methanocellales archaeon]